MINAQIEIIIIASLTAIACAIPGVYLVLRKMTTHSDASAMLSNAVSHSIILGIVIAFFFVQTLDSPVLVAAAGLTGIVTVLFVEWLVRTKLVKEDAAIGVVYPLMFSVAIVLISLFASQVPVDTDAVLTGELAFAPLNRFMVDGRDIGPVTAYQIGSVALINSLLVLLFYKKIKIVLFDESHAMAIGLKPKRFQYGLMVVVSFTTVVAFEAVGSIMVVGLMVGPAVVAALFTKRLWTMLFLAPLTGVIATLCGYWSAHQLNASIAGSIVVILGIFFVIAFFIGPNGGMIERHLIYKRKSESFIMNLLLVHLWQHEVLGEATDENNQYTIAIHLNWNGEIMSTMLRSAQNNNYLTITPDGIIHLLPEGIMRAKSALER